MKYDCMTSSGLEDAGAVVASNYSRVQKKGQVTIPVEMRERLGLREGDIVQFTETPDGILISPQEIVATRTLDAIGEILKAQGLTLDELIDSGRDARDQVLRGRGSQPKSR